MKFMRVFAHAGIACVLSVAPFVANAQVKFFAIGDLPGGIVQSEVRDTVRVGSALSAVGGSSAVGAGNDTAFLWTSTGGIVALPQLVAGLTDTNSVLASAITPDAAFIASRARFNAGNTAQRHGVRVTTSGLTNLDLGALPGFPQQSVANAISSDGAVLYGFARYEPGGKTRAVRYTTAGPTVTAIPFLNGTDTSSFSAGRGTSSDGSVMVGTSVNDAILVNNYGLGYSAFRYVQGAGVAAIPMLAGGTWNSAAALSPDGNLVLVGGDSTTAPNGEAYLYNATTAAVTRLGTPAAGWTLGNLAGLTPDGSVVVMGFGDPSDPVGAAFLRNSAGWHVVQTIVAGAGVDLTGWNLYSVVGISSDGTRIWGSGSHNGNPEGWIAEFPVGYLAAYGASLPAQSIVGTWTGTDTTTEGASALTFLNNGTYFHIQDARASEGPNGFDGYERGTYTWDPVTKAFALTTLVDYNGDIGPNGISGVPGITAMPLNNILSLNLTGAGGGAYSAPLVAGNSPIVGGWVLGDSTVADSSALIVFFENGTYLMADDTGPGDAIGHRGMERGTYSWNQGTGAFTTNALADTNGDWGLSNIGPSATVSITGNALTLTIPGDGAFAFARVAAAPLAPSVVVSETRRVHGTAGTLDLVLGGVSTNPTTESRIGPAHDLVFTFDKPVTGGNATVSEGTAVAGVPTFNGYQMTVPLSGVTNVQYVTVGVSGVTSADGGTGGSGSMRVGFLFGDVNKSRQVTVADVGQANSVLLQAVTPFNFQFDVNTDGKLTVADKGLVNANLLKKLPAP